MSQSHSDTTSTTDTRVANLGPIGTARPETVMAQSDIASLGAVAALHKPTGKPRDRVRSIFRRVGVDERALIVGGTHPAGSDAAEGSWFYDDRPVPGTELRMAVYREHAGTLAARASRDAITEAGVAADTITHLVTASCTGFAAPGVDIELIHALDLPAGVARTNVGFMGCHAAVNALRIAAAIATANHGARVLVCCVELCSIHLQHEDTPERDVVNALFGDGAAATVVTTQPVRRAVGAINAQSGFSSHVWPDGEDSMLWDITDAGFRMGLGRDVPERIREGARPWLGPWLQARGLDTTSVGSWAIHPGGPSVIDAVRDGMGLHEAACDASREVLRRCGNMSSATLLFVLAELSRRNAPLPAVAVAFGPGLAGEAVLVEYPASDRG